MFRTLLRLCLGNIKIHNPSYSTSHDCPINQHAVVYCFLSMTTSCHLLFERVGTSPRLSSPYLGLSSISSVFSETKQDKQTLLTSIEGTLPVFYLLIIFPRRWKYRLVKAIRRCKTQTMMVEFLQIKGSRWTLLINRNMEACNITSYAQCRSSTSLFFLSAKNINCLLSFWLSQVLFTESTRWTVS